MEKLFTKNLGGFMDSSNESETESCDYDSEEYIMPNGAHTGKRLKTQVNIQNGVGISQLKNVTSQSRNGRSIERLPTRRPDPKVSNRNALLARENRRRKKELVEQMENEFTEVKDENKSLKKMVKKQDRIIKKLSLEKSYLRSVLANRSEIVNLLKTLKHGSTPITSSAFDIKTKQFPLTSHSPSSSPSSASETDGRYKDPFLSETGIYEDLNCLFTDYMPYEKSSSGFVSMEDITGWDTLLSDNDNNYNTKDISDIQSEHNYTNSKYINADNDDKLLSETEQVNGNNPGVCLHISSGKISLEFCASCHMNAQSTWLDCI